MPDHRGAVTDALLAMLRSVTTGDSRPLRIGDHRAPEVVAPAKVPETPFADLRSLGGPPPTGAPFGDPHTDARHDFRLTSVGTNRRSAEALADAIRDAILGRGSAGYSRAITPAGCTVIGRDLLASTPATQEGDWWNVSDDFCLWTTSA